MSAENCGADLEGVDSLGECIDTMAGYESFAEFAHGHEDDGHFLRRLLIGGMSRFRCIGESWYGSH